jgi:predicted AAA+ superfamily ATPase
MIERDLANCVLVAAQSFPAVTITGPRQSGKSTLCRALFPGHPYVNLELPDQRQFALEDPRAFLAQFPDGEKLAERMRGVGLKNVKYWPLTLGIATLYVGRK